MFRFFNYDFKPNGKINMKKTPSLMWCFVLWCLSHVHCFKWMAFHFHCDAYCQLLPLPAGQIRHLSTSSMQLFIAHVAKQCKTDILQVCCRYCRQAISYHIISYHIIIIYIYIYISVLDILYIEYIYIYRCRYHIYIIIYIHTLHIDVDICRHI